MTARCPTCQQPLPRVKPGAWTVKPRALTIVGLPYGWNIAWRVTEEPDGGTRVGEHGGTADRLAVCTRKYVTARDEDARITAECIAVDLAAREVAPTTGAARSSVESAWAWDSDSAARKSRAVIVTRANALLADAVREVQS